MPNLPPEHFLSQQGLQQLAQLEGKINDFHRQRTPFAAKLHAGTHSAEDLAEVARFNRKITANLAAQKVLLNKNPLLAKNLVDLDRRG